MNKALLNIVKCHMLCKEKQEQEKKKTFFHPFAILYQKLTLKAQQNISHLNINILMAFTKNTGLHLIPGKWLRAVWSSLRATVSWEVPVTRPVSATVPLEVLGVEHCDAKVLGVEHWEQLKIWISLALNAEGIALISMDDTHLFVPIFLGGGEAEKMVVC